MTDFRYSELKYDGKVYTEQWKIDEILINNKFNWVVNAEIKNARIEIFQDTLIWNAGIWYNGDWDFGVWRDGEWRYGKWQNGVWYNGVWKNGTFKSGIIYNGKFFKGEIESGEIRGGQFINILINKNVTQYTEEEFQEKEQESQIVTQEKNEYKKMKKIKDFKTFKESVGEYEDSFIKINNDETSLEVSEKPSGKLKQKAGKEIIETPSKTDAYNALMRKGGDIFQEEGFADKQIHNVKENNNSIITKYDPRHDITYTIDTEIKPKNGDKILDGDGDIFEYSDDEEYYEIIGVIIDETKGKK
jgi:hypothetical protein